MGRINFGARLPDESKGILGAVRLDRRNYMTAGLSTTAE